MARDVKIREANRKKELAESFFVNGEYDRAISIYSDILLKNANDKEATIGVLLCDLATEREADAQAMFDYYRIIKSEEVEHAEDFALEVIRNLDNGFEIVNSLMAKNINMRPHYIEGIMYRDFKEIVHEKGNFRVAFEDLMFSTRVVISEKEEFLEFIEDLIDNGYNDIAFTYIENMGKLFAGDERVRELLLKLESKSLYDHNDRQ